MIVPPVLRFLTAVCHCLMVCIWIRMKGVKCYVSLRFCFNSRHTDKYNVPQIRCFLKSRINSVTYGESAAYVNSGHRQKQQLLFLISIRNFSYNRLIKSREEYIWFLLLRREIQSSWWEKCLQNAEEPQRNGEESRIPTCGSTWGYQTEKSIKYPCSARFDDFAANPDKGACSRL